MEAATGLLLASNFNYKRMVTFSIAEALCSSPSLKFYFLNPKYSNSFFSFQLCATLGTTGACAYDNLKELGPICKSPLNGNNISMYVEIKISCVCV